MQVVIWIIIILVAIFLIWILRKWIKRIIFIAILLCLAFFIYGIFSPSGASRLWYNVRTFPNRVISWVSSNKEFLDYDSYKKDISSVWAKIEDAIDTDILEPVVEKDNNKWDKSDSKDTKKDTKKDNAESKTDSKKDNKEPVEVKTTKNNDKLFSASDVLTVINKYVNDNLDDDTDILVTIDYDDKHSPEKIVLRTQEKTWNSLHFVSIPRLSVKNVSNGLQRSKTSVVTVISWKEESSKVKTPENTVKTETTGVKTTQSQNTTKTTETRTVNWLTQSEVREAEQIFSILF